MKNGIVIPEPTADAKSPPRMIHARVGRLGMNRVELTPEG
jgi:hypothetical protein